MAAYPGRSTNSSAAIKSAVDLPGPAAPPNSTSRSGASRNASCLGLGFFGMKGFCAIRRAFSSAALDKSSNGVTDLVCCHLVMGHARLSAKRSATGARMLDTRPLTVFLPPFRLQHQGEQVIGEASLLQRLAIGPIDELARGDDVFFHAFHRKPARLRLQSVSEFLPSVLTLGGKIPVNRHPALHRMTRDPDRCGSTGERSLLSIGSQKGLLFCSHRSVEMLLGWLRFRDHRVSESGMDRKKEACRRAQTAKWSAASAARSNNTRCMLSSPRVRGVCPRDWNETTIAWAASARSAARRAAISSFELTGPIPPAPLPSGAIG